MKRKLVKGMVTLAVVAVLAGGVSMVAYARPSHHSGAVRFVQLQSLDRYQDVGCHGLGGHPGRAACSDRLDCEPAVACDDRLDCAPAAACDDKTDCAPAACYRDGVCSEYGSCDEDGVCKDGGICQGPWCEQDGSCDVNGVCQNGTDCSGSIHSSRTHHGDGHGHHGGGRRSGHHH